MANTLTKVQTAKILAIFNKLGLTVIEQPSQYRVQDESGTRRLYVPGTKTVHKVELSGFTHELAVSWESVFGDKKAPSGKITQVVDFAQEEKLVLRSIFKIAKTLVKAAKVEAPVEAPPATETAPVEGEVAAG